MKGNIFFYKRLQKHDKSLVDLLSNKAFFVDLPEDWVIVVVDVANSTQAVQNGMHESVNLTATGSIVTVLNEIKKTDRQIRIPYFFGGDGTTFIIPSKFQEKVLSLLENYRHHVKRKNSLILRVGCIDVEAIYKLNHKIKIAKLALTEHLTIPIALGSGLKYAEEVIKSSFIDSQIKESEIETVQLVGMECRWEKIEPKEDDLKIVCLLANCISDQIQIDIYKIIFEKINELFGTYEERNPIAFSKLQLDASPKKIRAEFNLKFSKYNVVNLIKNWMATFFGKYYLKIKKEKIEYFKNIPLLSDTIMVDGSIHTVFSGTQQKIDLFLTFLDELERDGKIKYGIHITHSSIMSCYVQNRKDQHIHFVDGTEGGYTKAAVMYKSKINNINSDGFDLN